MSKRISTEKLAFAAILTALVVILQFMGAFIRLGLFSVSMVLVPIVIGAATCGAGIGAWLGGVFGLVVLMSGDAAAFLAVNPIGTIITVMIKGILCGFGAGLAYRLLAKKNRYLAVIAAAFVCPVINTGVFLAGCVAFFMETIRVWAVGLGFADASSYMIFGLAGGNFLFELAVNLILSPVIVRLLNIKRGSI